MKKRQSWWMIGLSALIFLFAGYGFSSAQSEKVIKLGVINPLTGPAAPWGLTVKCRMEAVQKFFNDRGGITVKGQNYKIEMVFADDKYTVAGGRAAGEKLIYTDKVDFLVGSVATESIAGWAPLATKEKKLAVIGGPNWTPKREWPYMFRVTSNDNERAVALCLLMKEKYDCKSVLYIMSDDLVGKNGKEDAVKNEKARGLKVKGYLMVPPNTTDFYPFLSKALKSNPDFLFSGLPPGSVALVVKQARELGYKGKIGYPVAIPGNLKKWQEIAGIEASMGFIAIMSSPEGSSPLGVEFDKYFEQHCPNFKNSSIAIPMGPHILLMAIEKAQSFNPDEISKVLRTMEFHSFHKIPVRAGGEKTYGIKNHITIPTSYSVVVGADQAKYLKTYYIMSP